MGKKIDTSKAAEVPAPAIKPAAAVKPAATKKAAPKKAAKSPATPAAAPKKATASRKPAFSHDDVALRAYFIAEKRLKAGLPGDSHQDWVEAERQLTAESKKKKPAAKSA